MFYYSVMPPPRPVMEPKKGRLAEVKVNMFYNSVMPPSNPAMKQLKPNVGSEKGG